MKKTFVKAAAAAGLCVSLLAMAVPASAATMGPDNQRWFPQQQQQQQQQFGGAPGQRGGQPGGMMNNSRMDGRMVISEPGEYTLTGDMRGTVYVDPGAGDVKLVLDGANINGANGPAIMAVSGDRLDIEVKDGSVNGLNGGPGGQFGAAVYSEVPVSFEGGGQLDLRSEGPDAVRVEQGGPSFNFAPDANVSMNGSAFNSNQAPGMAQNGPQNAAPAGNPGNGQNNAFGAPNQQQSGFPGDNRNNDQTPIQNGQQAAAPGNRSGSNSQFPGNGQNIQQTQQGNSFGDMRGGAAASSTASAGEIATGITENSAMALAADYDDATTIVITDENSAVKITDSGTYVVTGSSSDGSITVKKETTGVVLVLNDLDLTSTSGAALSVNKNAEVQIVISGNVTLTDGENPADEYSGDAAVADAYDGAAIKVKAGSTVYITGDGALTVNGDAKNGIKAGDDSSLIIGGDVTMDINAVNDGINGNYDVTILSGDVTISAGDDGIHADHILTIGADGTGPNLTVTNSTEGLEGTVVNIAGGTVNVTASDDGINAANGDGVYEGELGYSVNITGGDVTVNAKTDGIDSNGNVNLIGGSAAIHSANNGGDAGIDYDGDLYISDSFGLNNFSGVAGPDGMGGAPGQMGGVPGTMGGMNGQAGGMSGNMGGMNAAPGGNGGFGGGMGGGFRPGR